MLLGTPVPLTATIGTQLHIPWYVGECSWWSKFSPLSPLALYSAAWPLNLKSFMFVVRIWCSSLHWRRPPHPPHSSSGQRKHYEHILTIRNSQGWIVPLCLVGFLCLSPDIPCGRELNLCLFSKILLWNHEKKHNWGSKPDHCLDVPLGSFVSF